VQVVRQGEPSEIVADAELFLLTDPHTLAVFNLSRIVEIMSWLKPDLLYVRVHDGRQRSYAERAVVDAEGRFVRFERIYAATESRMRRVALTPDRRLAQLWQRAVDTATAWRELRAETDRSHRSVASVQGSLFDRSWDAEVARCLRHLVRFWPRPDSTVWRVRQLDRGVWVDMEASIERGAAIIGPVWIGAGRKLDRSVSIVGPRILWDDPACRPPVQTLQWQQIEPSLAFVRTVRPRKRRSLALATKRAFDIVFAIVVLVLTLPLYPLVMLAIWLEDGRPFFFIHRRETLGGRQFGCIKFRSMRRDADEIKRELMALNQADGPQFYMEEDPRLTRVGRFLRRTYIDELPQFWNVLLGHMSVVGPRPSPYSENQYCPPWREARLSVRPGITGLWQVRRTRRRGLDFQEWIKYDLEYVENASWRLDLRIIWETLKLFMRGVIRS